MRSINAAKKLFGEALGNKNLKPIDEKYILFSESVVE